MSAWNEIRRQARLRHDELIGAEEKLVPASIILAKAQTNTKVICHKVPPQDPLLDGGEAAYDRDNSRIYYSSATEPDVAAFHIAHEFGHHWLAEILISCRDTDLDVETPAEPEMSLVGELDAYSPKERAEAQANLFAREFLLPRPKLRQYCARGTFIAKDIAREVGVPDHLVMQQLADALLLPQENSEDDIPREELPPDSTQLQAIEAPLGPRGVRAGPGTGKTRTLIGRIGHLLDKKEDPSSILVLTFSNLAAQDLGLRIRNAVGPHATAIWASTFHAFGLELLRKYGSTIDLPLDVRLLDRSNSLLLLEELLPQLDLSHYLDLAEPTRPLRSILNLIARAKDEVASPARYVELATALRQSATNDDERKEGDKALEVARAYQVYEQELRKRGFVDFGDLIVRPIEMFERNSEVRDAVRDRWRHVLVDEYQDMNRASAVFLRALVTPGQGPWIVGDVRQSIYRFRGASPTNIVRFHKDFPGAATTDLGINYRSLGRIVGAFETFGKDMLTGNLAPTPQLEPHRGKALGVVGYEIAATRDAENEGIAQALRADVAKGGRFGRHTIIARSHTTLARLADSLEDAGVPCLYFGDFFERPEIRDLLSVLSLVAEPSGIGLVRAARFAQYQVPWSDLSAVLAWQREHSVTALQALREFGQIPNISSEGKAGLARLVEDVAHATFPVPPHQFLLTYLFARGDHLQSLVTDQSVRAQQRRLAIYQLLQFAFSFQAPAKSDPKRALLDHIRRLEILDEEKQLRQLPAAATGIDAVRMMTVHASKGLQFEVVHIPSVTARHFPVNRSDPNPPPPGLVDTDQLMSREAEEESLFFVAMSRAQDELHLSRAIFHGGGGWQDVKPSPYLQRIKAHLPKPVDTPASWTAESPAKAAIATLAAPPAREAWHVAAVETYQECPRRFYYAEVLALGSRDPVTPYLRFQSVLHSSMAWLRGVSTHQERKAGISARLEADWEKSGLGGHSHESLYRISAEQMLNTAVATLEGGTLPVDISFTTDGGATIMCRADQILSEGRKLTVRRFKAGRLASQERSRARYGVMQAAVARANPQAKIEFEHVSLLTGDRRQATITAGRLAPGLAKLDKAFEGIRAGRFDPITDDYRCPRCPFYFICPSTAL